MPPVIRFACPTCLKKLKAPEKAIGQKVHCPRCTQLIIIPVPPEVKSTPKMGLLLPGVGSASAPAKEPDSSFIEHEIADSMTPSDFNPLDDPPPVQVDTSNTKVLEDDTSSFVSEDQPTQEEQPSIQDEPVGVEQPIYYEVPAKHPVQAIISAAGAVVMALLLIFAWQSLPVRSRPIARGIGVSCALTGLIWCLLSLKTRCKIFWIIVGCIANLLLLVLSLV
jgi:hypothetical protein